MNTRRTLGQIAVAAVLAPVLALAQTVTWTNPAGGNWTVGTNWDTGTPPAAGNNVVISNLAGQAADYTVNLSHIPATTFGTLTVGGGGGGYAETFAVSRGTNAYGDPTFQGITINTDGALYFANLGSWNGVGLSSGGTVTNHGTIYGSPHMYNQGFFGPGSGTRPIFYNRGTIDINGKPGGYLLVFNGFEFDNSGTTVNLDAGEDLRFQYKGSHYPFVHGGTFNVSGILQFDHSYGTYGTVADPIVLDIKAGGQFVQKANGASCIYDLTNRGTVTISGTGGGGLINTNADNVLDNYGSVSAGRVKWTGTVYNRAGADWSTRNEYSQILSAGTFTNDGTVSLGNASSIKTGNYIEGTYVNNGTWNFTATDTEYQFGGSASSVTFTNSATGVINKTANLETKLRGTLTNNGTINYAGRLNIYSGGELVNNKTLNLDSTTRAVAWGGYASTPIVNGTANSVIAMNGADLGNTMLPGTHDYAYVRQTDAGALIQGYGTLNVDALSNGTNWGRLVGTIQATGGTMTVMNWTAATYPGDLGTIYNNADTLTTATDSALVANAGTLVLDNLTQPATIHGKLGLYNGGTVRVNSTSAGLTIGATGYIENNGGMLEIGAGNLLVNSTQNTLFSALGTTLVFSGTNQTLGLASQDLGGADAAFFDDNFAYRMLSLAGTGGLNLIDGSGDALYLLGLDFSSGMLLDMNDHNVYVKGYLALPDGSSITAPYGNPLVFTAGDLGGLLTGGGMLTLSYMPEPSALLLLALAGIASLGRRPRRR